MAVGALFALISCTERIDTSNRYVFKERTIIDYLNQHSETYSTYADLLFRVPVSTASKTTVGQLLTARGRYTVFAPTNQAIQSYLDSLAVSADDDYITAPTWDAFTDSTKLDSIRRVIVQNSIIDSGDNDKYYSTFDFPQHTGEEFPLTNMLGGKLSVKYADNNPDSIYINVTCPINANNRNILTINGVIHQMEKVIAPREVSAADYLMDLISHQREGYLVMARARPLPWTGGPRRHARRNTPHAGTRGTHRAALQRKQVLVQALPIRPTHTAEDSPSQVAHTLQHHQSTICQLRRDVLRASAERRPADSHSRQRLTGSLRSCLLAS